MFWTKKRQPLFSSFSEISKKDYKILMRRLFETPLHAHVRHQVELPDLDDGLAWASGLKERLWVYDTLKDFDLFINGFHQPNESYDCGPWVLEQKADPFLKQFGFEDGPIIGIGYKIFYNSEQIGNLEFHPLSEFNADDLEAESKEILVALNVQNAMLIPFEHLDGMMSLTVTRLLSDENYSKSSAISNAINRTLWEFNRTGNAWLDLDFEYAGKFPM